MFEHGILIEPHGQNFFLEIDTSGRIYHLVLKDWQSTMVDLELRLRAGLSQSRKSIIKHLLGEEASKSTSLSIIFDHYWGNYLMRQLLDVLVERYHGGMDRTSFRQMLLNRFKGVFERYYNEYPESKKEFSDIALRHGQKPLTDKTNTVFFAASGAPLLRFTEYERRISELKKNPSLRKGKITVPVTKVVEPNTVIQRQQYLPDNLEIDFDRIQVYGRTVTSAGDLKRLLRGTSVKEVDCTVIFPENYKKGRQYDCIVVLSGKGSHPARLMDFPEKTGMKDTIFIYPNAVFPFGRRYIRFDEQDESEAHNVSAHVIRNIISFFQNKKIISENIFIAGIADGGNLAQHMGALFPKLIKGIITVKTPFKELAIPALFLNPEGFRDNIDSVLGDDIRNWIYTQLDKVQPDITPLPLPLRDGIAAVHMAENVIPFLLHLMPKGTTERERIFIRQFDLLVSALCYCRFQLEIKINDPDIRSDTHRLESVKWMDINTVEWLEKQTISLLEQVFTFFERQGTDTIPHRNIERSSSISK